MALSLDNGTTSSSSSSSSSTKTKATDDAAEEGVSSRLSGVPTQAVVVPPFFLDGSNQGPSSPKHLAVLKTSQKNFGGSLKITSWYVVSDTRQHQRPFAIGVLTIFLVVCFLRFSSYFELSWLSRIS